MTYYECENCGRADGLDAVLPNDLWERVSKEAGGWNIMCLWCMDRVAKRLGIKASCSLHFAGEALTGTSDSDANRDHVRRLVAQRTSVERQRDEARARISGYESILVRTETEPLAVPGADRPIMRPTRITELLDRLAALERVRVVAEALESATTAYKVLFGTKWLHQKLREALAGAPPKREGGE